MHNSISILALSLTLSATAAVVPAVYPRGVNITAAENLAKVDPNVATGTCKLVVNEYDTCADDNEDLWADIALTDGKGNPANELSQTDHSGDDGRVSINVKDPYTFYAGLPHPLVLVGEHRGDYVQFQYGDVGWNSGTTGADGKPSCTTTNWDHKHVDCVVVKSMQKTKVGPIPFPLFEMMQASVYFGIRDLQLATTFISFTFLPTHQPSRLHYMLNPTSFSTEHSLTLFAEKNKHLLFPLLGVLYSTSEKIRLFNHPHVPLLNHDIIAMLARASLPFYHDAATCPHKGEEASDLSLRNLIRGHWICI